MLTASQSGLLSWPLPLGKKHSGVSYGRERGAHKLIILLIFKKASWKENVLREDGIIIIFHAFTKIISKRKSLSYYSSELPIFVKS